MALGIKLPLSAAAEDQIESWLPECYNADDYPRAGCTVVIEANPDAHGTHGMKVFAPTGKLLESYIVPSEMVGGYVDTWLGGKVPNKFTYPVRDRASPGKAD